MSAVTYCATRVPRPVRFTASAPQPAAYYAKLLSHALNHGLPARRRGGPLWAAAGRNGLPTPVVAAGLRLLPRRPAPDLDRLLRDAEEQWPGLAARSRLLPSTPTRLSVLEVERSSGSIVFVFDTGEHPVLVLKSSRAGEEGAEREAAALQRAGASAIAPQFLGRMGSAWAEEGMPGMPLWVSEVTPGNAGELPWTHDFAELSVALQRLARTTTHRSPAPEELLAALDRAQVPDLPSTQRRLVAAARRDLSRLDLSVLQHRDLSAQNWLVNSFGFVGAVDWEMSSWDGVPGFDLLHAAVSVFEHGVGLRTWSSANVAQVFRQAWRTSALFEGARSGSGATAACAGVREDLWQPLQLAFFARRLGRQVAGVSHYSLESEALMEMITTVCGD